MSKPLKTVLATRVIKTYDSEEMDSDFTITLVRKRVILEFIESYEVFEDEDYTDHEMIFIVNQSGDSFVIIGNFKEFDKIYTDFYKTKNLFIFANN